MLDNPDTSGLMIDNWLLIICAEQVYELSIISWLLYFKSLKNSQKTGCENQKSAHNYNRKRTRAKVHKSTSHKYLWSLDLCSCVLVFATLNFISYLLTCIVFVKGAFFESIWQFSAGQGLACKIVLLKTDNSNRGCRFHKDDYFNGDTNKFFTLYWGILLQNTKSYWTIGLYARNEGIVH